MNSGLTKGQYMVGIRSNGLAMDSIIGIVDDKDSRKVHKLVGDDYVAMLVRISNNRFTENFARINKLTSNLETALFTEKTDVLIGWEDKEVRKARKKAEGLQRQLEELLAAEAAETDEPLGDE